MENSSNWLPVVGTLGGAIVAGGISFILHWSSNRHARVTLDQRLSEERARWAVEYELEQLRLFYGTTEKLISAAENFRLQQAWARREPPAPDWILPYVAARGEIEDAILIARSEALLLNEEIQSEFQTALKGHQDWFLSRDENQAVDNLLRLEKDLQTFKKYLAAYFRKVFYQRKRGIDVAPKHNNLDA